MVRISNFGGNVRFEPRHFCRPATEAELLEILAKHSDARIRVVGSKHSWSDAIASGDVLIDMSAFNSVEVQKQDGEPVAVVGGGCQIKHLLFQLNQHGLTTPSVGLITEQTIAGATATGTHGSGKHSLSHYLASVRIACFRGGEAAIVEVTGGDELRAARCSLGCMGVVVSVTLPCVPQYNVLECSRPCDNIEEALSTRDESPLQQFFLFPHQWKYSVQERRPTDSHLSPSAPFYRAYWYACIDIGLHALIKLAVCVLQSRPSVQWIFQHILPLFIFPSWRVVDRSDRALVMEHELFRHLELEAFVPEEHVVEAAHCVETILRQADGSLESVPSDLQAKLDQAGLGKRFEALRAKFSHHYPVCFRRILRDDTLISMASGDSDSWYSISFITYYEPRGNFYVMAEFLADACLMLYGGRIHWGKWFPFQTRQIDQMYPEIETYRRICREFDPNGVFQNEFTQRIFA